MLGRGKEEKGGGRRWSLRTGEGGGNVSSTGTKGKDGRKPVDHQGGRGGEKTTAGPSEWGRKRKNGGARFAVWMGYLGKKKDANLCLTIVEGEEGAVAIPFSR